MESGVPLPCRTVVRSPLVSRDAPLASSLVQAALLATIWNIVLAAVLGVAALGCSAGKGLVEESSARTGKPQPEPHG